MSENKSACGHPDYRIGRDGKLHARDEKGDWVTNNTLSLVSAYIEAIGRHGAGDSIENRQGYFHICETLEEFRGAIYDDYIRHLDAIVPATADAA